jgi:hypothetical protein
MQRLDNRSRPAASSRASAVAGDLTSAHAVTDAATDGLAHSRSRVARSARRLTGVAVLTTSLIVLACMLASSALADFGIASFDGSVNNQDGSPATQAGSHPFSATTSITFNTVLDANSLIEPDGGSAKDLQVDLPAGFVGNPTATPKCREDQLESGLGACPDDSQVGVVTLDFGGGFGAGHKLPVFNMIAPPGVPGQFGFNVSTLGIVHLDARVRSGTDYGLTVDASAISQTLPVVSTRLTFWGVPADPSHDPERGICLSNGGVDFNGAACSSGTAPAPFLTNPSDCSTGPVTTTLRADSWLDPGNFGTASFVSHDNATPANLIGPSGCARVPFEPTLTVHAESRVAGAPSAFSVDLHVPQNENPTGLAQAALKKAVVTLPQGVSVSPSAANGLGACSLTAIGLDTGAAAACPDSAKIGAVEIHTPLLATPLTGSIYLAQQGSNPFGSLLALYLVAEGGGVVVKLPGEVEANSTTGQLSATFDNNPQLPFEDLTVNFIGGSGAPLVNPATCGTYTTRSELTSWSGKTVESDSSFSIDQGERGAPCPTGGFAPTFVAGTANPQAGAMSPFTLTLSRSDSDQALGALSVRMPPGLLGVLKSVVQCQESQASQGACGPESLIGRTTVGAGPGPDPFYLGGQVFLTGPYRGAHFGLSIVVPAIAGPFNLGTVVERASVAVDPTTGQLTVTSDPLPQILQGIPLDLRTINVTVDRAGFIFNPTNCSPLDVSGVVQSAQNASLGVSSPFQATNCATLSFKPRFSVSTQGKTSKAAGASLSVKVTSGAGQANIGKVAVSLPKQLPSRLTTLQKACLAAVFETNPAQCPAGSLVGSATAITPILAHSLTGPAYLVSHGGEAFPDLVIVLQGEGIRIDLDGKTKIKNGITSNSFNTVPDAPISSFALSLPEGPHSVLATNLPAKANRSLCGQSLTMPTTLTGQNGAVAKQVTKITVSGCPKAKPTKKKAARGRRARRRNAKKR